MKIRCSRLGAISLLDYEARHLSIIPVCEPLLGNWTFNRSARKVSTSRRVSDKRCLFCCHYPRPF
jgi:hypothetical protein